MRTGSVLIYVVMICGVLTAMAAFAADQAVSHSALATTLRTRSTLRQIADGAALDGVNRLRNSTSLAQGLSTGSETTLASTTVMGRPVSTSAIRLADQRILLRATVSDAATRMTRRVETMLTPLASTSTTTAPATALFAVDDYTFMGATAAQVYDSAPASVETGYMLLESNHSVSVAKPGNVAGGASAARSWADVTLPQVVYQVPSGATELGAITAPVTLTSGTYHCSSVADVVITVTGNATLYCDGAYGADQAAVFGSTSNRLTVIQGDFSATSAKTTINGSAMVGAGVATGAAYASQFIFATAYAGEITMNGNGSFGGVILAPYATCKLNGTFDLYGALWTRTFYGNQINGNYTVHYDSELMNLSLTLPTSATPDYQVTGYRSW